MSDPKLEETSAISDMVTTWMKNANAMWETIANAYPAKEDQAKENTGDDMLNLYREKMAANFKLWRAAAKTLEEPETAEAFIKGIQNIPDASTRLMHNSIESVTKLQAKWFEHIEKKGDSSGAYTFDNSDGKFLSQWTDLYEKEIQKFFNIPQLGLTKFYQEKFNRTVDKTNMFQTALTEFLQLLFIPLEKSVTTLQEKLSDLVSEGKLPEDNHDYYRMWIQILEGHYAALFRSSDYTNSLSKTLDTLNQFLYSRSQILENVLQTLPVATHQEMDSLYRDFHQLKRRIIALEKRMQQKHQPLKEENNAGAKNSG